jgi:hypothetical protein
LPIKQTLFARLMEIADRTLQILLPSFDPRFSTSITTGLPVGYRFGNTKVVLAYRPRYVRMGLIISDFRILEEEKERITKEIKYVLADLYQIIYYQSTPHLEPELISLIYNLSQHIHLLLASETEGFTNLQSSYIESVYMAAFNAMSVNEWLEARASETIEFEQLIQERDYMIQQLSSWRSQIRRP